MSRTIFAHTHLAALVCADYGVHTAAYCMSPSPVSGECVGEFVVRVHVRVRVRVRVRVCVCVCVHMGVCIFPCL